MENLKAEKLEKRIYRLGCLLVLGLLLAWVGGIAWFFHDLKSHFDSGIVSVRSIADLERRSHLRFPPGSELVDGRALFGIGGGNLGARVRVPTSALPEFLTQPALYVDPQPPPDSPPVKIPTVAGMAATIAKAASTPSPKMTDDEIGAFDHSLGYLGVAPEKLGRQWKVERVRHLLWIDTYDLSGLSVGVDLDNPALPIVYVTYYYT